MVVAASWAATAVVGLEAEGAEAMAKAAVAMVEAALETVLEVMLEVLPRSTVQRFAYMDNKPSVQNKSLRTHVKAWVGVGMVRCARCSVSAHLASQRTWSPGSGPGSGSGLGPGSGPSSGCHLEKSRTR